jgi:large subunit ribosomal protein L20
MRVKGGTTKKRRHKKILKSTKGYRMTKSKLYKVAHEAYLHAGKYSYADRKKRHAQMKQLWIKRINAASQNNGLKYSELMDKLKKSNVLLNRKVLSDLSLNHPEVFTAIVKDIKK